MKSSLFLAHVDILVPLIIWFGVTYGTAAVACILALKKKKVSALVTGIPAFGLSFAFMFFSKDFFVFVPLILSCWAILQAMQIKRKPGHGSKSPTPSSRDLP